MEKVIPQKLKGKKNVLLQSKKKRMFVLSKTSTSVLHYSSYVRSSQYPETGRLRFGVQKVISDKRTSDLTDLTPSIMYSLSTII